MTDKENDNYTTICMSAKRFIQQLSEYHLPNTFNPWRDTCPEELSENGCLDRRERCIQHLTNPLASLVIVGEAPGYQGCRYSGVAFTSERLLLEGVIPRMPALQGKRITSRPRPWSEPSATIVWGALHEQNIAESTVLHNAFPFHPEGGRGIHSNRTPTEKERQVGLVLLEVFLEMYSGVQVAALGNTASKSLTEVGVSHTKLRHPANGGATKFRQGLRDLLS